MVYYGDGRRLEYDFVVAPHADARAVALDFRGAGRLEIDAAGDLVLHTAAGELRQHRPFAYQTVGDERRAVESRYVRLGGSRVGFEVGAYDRSKPLVIDPVLSYSTYLGGVGYEMPSGIGVDGAGNAYVIGGAGGGDFPTTPNSYRQSYGGGFLLKLDSSGGLAYSTSIDGDTLDIAVGADGTAYVTGTTFSPSFPVTPNALVTTPGSKNIRGEPGDSFLQRYRLKGDGAADLLHSSYAHARRVAVDPAGNVYLGDSFTKTERPTTPNAVFASHLRNDICYQDPVYGESPCSDVYVQKLRPTGAGGYEVAYGTWLGGKGLDALTDLAADARSFVYAVGTTRSTPSSRASASSANPTRPSSPPAPAPSTPSTTRGASCASSTGTSSTARRTTRASPSGPARSRSAARTRSAAR